MAAETIVQTLTTLRDDGDCQFEQLIDICGVDYPERAKRFDVVYHLLSPRRNQRMRVQVRDGRRHAGAERRRACSRPPTGTSGRPTTCTASCSRAIRICAASSPTTASRAIRCARTSRSPATSRCATTTTQKRVVYEPVKLTQEFRVFDFVSPWEGDGLRAARR